MVLSAAQITRMSQLLDEALELDPESRRHWLQTLPPEHRDLEPALRRALFREGSDNPGGVRLDTLPKVGAADSSLAADTLIPGARVGPYELVRMLGKGGMAQVWLARRADGAYQRDVALKIPVDLHLREAIAPRFARERDILASLEHSNIARFYDAGVTQDERQPYLALELVDGKNLTAWADEHSLTIEQRIDLFKQVLDAVEYAHNKGVLHRDLKPSNILVTDSGQVRLLDFGVARLFEQPTADRLTQIHGKALTPAYASPEQIKDEELQPASDVYSLGVVFYELLCGQRPTPAAGDLTLPAPSTRITGQAAKVRAASPSSLVLALRGDLDAIAAKTLSVDSSLRYDSAASFAEDLQRYLAGHPVEARGSGIAYRTAKFIRRHRPAVTIAAVGSIAVMVLTGYVVLHRAASVRSVSATVAPPSARSVAVLPFADMSEKHDQEYFSDGLTEELINRLTHGANLKVIARTSSFAFKGRNEDVRSIAARLGAANVVEGSVRSSGGLLRITAQLIRASDGVQLWSQSYDREPRDIFKVQDEVAEAVAQKLGSAVGRGQSTRPPSNNIEAYNLFLQSRYFHGKTTKEDLARAQILVEQALRLDPGYARAWAEAAAVYVDRGISGWMRTESAIENAKSALTQALSLDPDLAEGHRILGWIFMAFDWDWGAAREQFSRAHELDPDDLVAMEDLANINFGIYGDSAATADADRKILARDPLNATALSNLTLDLINAHRYPEALVAARRLLVLHPTYMGAHSFEAQALLYMGRFDEALTAEQAESDEAARCGYLAVIYWALGRRPESDLALKTLRDKYADTSSYDIGLAHAYRGETDAAFQQLERAFRNRIFEMLYIRSEPLLANVRGDTRYHDLLVRMKLDDAARPPTN